MFLKCLVNLCFIQKVDLCHILLKVVERDDLLRCRPLNLLNLYSFPTRNLLDLVARDLAACISAEFFLLWSSPLIPLKMNPPTFLIPVTIFPKMLPPLKMEVMPLISPPRNLLCLFRVTLLCCFCINCICFQRYGFSILGYIVQCPLYF